MLKADSLNKKIYKAIGCKEFKTAKEKFFILDGVMFKESELPDIVNDRESFLGFIDAFGFSNTTKESLKTFKQRKACKIMLRLIQQRSNHVPF